MAAPLLRAQVRRRPLVEEPETVDSLPSDPDGCTTETDEKLGRSFGADHGSLPALRAELALSVVEPLEEVEVPLREHVSKLSPRETTSYRPRGLSRSSKRLALAGPWDALEWRSLAPPAEHLQPFPGATHGRRRSFWLTCT